MPWAFCNLDEVRPKANKLLSCYSKVYELLSACRYHVYFAGTQRACAYRKMGITS